MTWQWSDMRQELPWWRWRLQMAVVRHRLRHAQWQIEWARYLGDTVTELAVWDRLDNLARSLTLLELSHPPNRTRSR